MEIYVCSEGEYVVYNDASDGIRSGYLCRVRGIKSGRVHLQTVPISTEILCRPERIIDCGEYGEDISEHAGHIDKDKDEEVDVDEENFVWDESDELPHIGSSSATDQRIDAVGLQAEILRLQGCQAAALDILTSIIGNGSEAGASVLVTAAKCSIDVGNHEAAMHYLTSGHHLDHGNVNVMCMLGHIYESLGDIKAAQKWYSSAVDADTSSPLPYLFMAALLFNAHGISQREECIRLLRTGCVDCVQVDASQSPLDATAMYMCAATLLEQLHGDSELITRACLRVVNIARFFGALEERIQATNEDTLRERLRRLETARLREAAIGAFFELGRLLERTGKQMVHTHLTWRPDEQDQEWQPVPNKAKRGKEKRTSTATSRHDDVPGVGFLHGARGAFWMCTTLGTTQTQHVEALQRVESLLM